MAEPFIRISNLSKSYETPAGPLCVLGRIDLRIPRGEFVALVGPSGGGMTTFLNMITGVDRPSSGDVVVDGVDVAHTSERKLTRWRGRNVGIVFQFFQLLPTLTVLENVTLPMHYTGTYKGERKERAMELLELVDQGKTMVMVTHDRELAGNIPRVEEVRNGMLMSQEEIDRRLVVRR